MLRLKKTSLCKRTSGWKSKPTLQNSYKDDHFFSNVLQSDVEEPTENLKTNQAYVLRI